MNGHLLHLTRMIHVRRCKLCIGIDKGKPLCLGTSTAVHPTRSFWNRIYSRLESKYLYHLQYHHILTLQGFRRQLPKYLAYRTFPKSRPHELRTLPKLVDSNTSQPLISVIKR